MKEREEKDVPQDKDRHLDIPAEANRDKHINFLDAEDAGSGNSSDRKDKETAERQKQWKQGLEEGREKLNGE